MSDNNSTIGNIGIESINADVRGSFKSDFTRKLSERDQALIRVYEEFIEGVENQVGAVLEADQRGFFVGEGKKRGGTLDGLIPDQDPNFAVSVKSTKNRSAASYKAAGRKAAKTRQKNGQAAKKPTKKTGKKTLAHHAVELPKAGGRNCNTFTRDQLLGIIEQVVTQNPGKYTSQELKQLIPTSHDVYRELRDELVQQGKIRCDGQVRQHADGPRVYNAHWFPA